MMAIEARMGIGTVVAIIISMVITTTIAAIGINAMAFASGSTLVE